MPVSRLPARRGEPLTITFEGEEIPAYEGETLASALLAAGVDAFHVTREGDPRLPLCNMGTCFDCVVTVDGRRLLRACLLDAEAGMAVEKHRSR